MPPVRLPVVNQGITLREIPGEISVFFELANCVCNCKGCHSDYLKMRLAPELFLDVQMMLDYAKEEKERGATAILLLGGTTNRLDKKILESAIIELGKILPVGIYSGAGVNSQATRFLMSLHPYVRWVKAGNYNYKLGGLNSPTTNQRFFTHENGKWVDTTSIFQ